MTTKKTGGKTAKNEVATTDPNANLPAPIIDYGDDFGDGLQDVGQDEVGIPFLKILQAQSPEVIGPNGQIEGARAGLFLNTGTSELIESMTIVPALRQHVFVEWRPRKSGGGIVAIHQADSDIVRAAQAASTEFGKYRTEEGNDLVETFYVYAVVLDGDDVAGFLVVPFSSTGIKHYRKRFMSRIRYAMVDDGTGRKRNPPIYAHRVVLTTTQESNDDGTWFNYDITFAVENNVARSLMKPDHPGFQAAAELKRMVEGGEAKADLDKAEQGDRGEEKADGGSAF